MDRARRGNYAFLGESMTIEYEVQRDCQLTQLGHFLQEQNYAIALPLNSPYRSVLSQAILHLRDTGKLTLLKHRWWNETYSSNNSNVTCSTSTFTTMKQCIDNLGSFFYICAFTILFICIIVIAECICRRSKRSKKNQDNRVSASTS